MTDVAIRKVGHHDIDTLMSWRMEVLREVFGHLDEHSAQELEKSNREYFKRALADSTHIGCFAMVDGETVGCGAICLSHEMPSPDNPNGVCAYLMNVYVRRHFRHLHIGQEIVAWLISQARMHKAGKIYLEASAAGRPLYQSMGFKDMPDMMKL